MCEFFVIYQSGKGCSKFGHDISPVFVFLKFSKNKPAYDLSPFSYHIMHRILMQPTTRRAKDDMPGMSGHRRQPVPVPQMW
jgi:hypothetical protein